MNQENDTHSVPGAPEEKPSMNAFQRLFGIFFSPYRTFQDIDREPSYILPLVILIIFSLVATFVIMPKIDMEAALHEKIEKSGAELTEEQMGKTLAFQEKIGKVAGYGASVVGPLFMTLIVSGLYFGIIRLCRAGSAFSKVFSVTVHAFVVSIVKTALSIVVALRLEDHSVLPEEIQNLVKSNLSIFLEREESTAALYTIASKIDLFNIWIIILTIIGLSVVSKWHIKQSATMVLILWLLWIAMVTVYMAMISAMSPA